MNFYHHSRSGCDSPVASELRPPRWLPGGHLQTIVPAVFGSAILGRPVVLTRERVSTPDDDFLDLDWHRQADTRKNPPLLVLFHGLEGSSRSPYAQAFARVATGYGWDYVVVHFRGCSGSINKAPRAYHSGDSAEIDWVLQWLAVSFPKRPEIMAIGVSLGGNALMRWAGEQGPRVHQRHGLVRAVAAISSPLDLAAAGRSIDQGMNRWLYARHFLATMIAKAQAKYEQFPGLFDIARVRKATTLRAFDDAFTAPLHGYAGVDDYWQRASAKPLLGDVRIPALLLNAQNDPFVPIASLTGISSSHGRLTCWQPREGGHAGFLSRTPAGASLTAMPESVVAWLAQASDRDYSGLGCAGAAGDV